MTQPPKPPLLSKALEQAAKEGRERMEYLKPKEYVLDRSSEYYLAAVEAGFTFSEIKTKVRTDNGYLFCEGSFTCACGKKESYFTSYDQCASKEVRNGKIDVAFTLELSQSYSIEHLRADGYSEEDILKIRKPFDKLTVA